MQGVLLRVFLLGGSVLAAVILGAPSRVKRVCNAAKYDNKIDAGIRGMGDLKHRSGLFAGYDAVSGYVVYKQNTSADTEWKFTSDNRWVHIADGKCVHPEDGSTRPPGNTPLVLGNCEPVNPERIKFVGVPDGDYWSIKHNISGMCIHPLGGTARVGVKLILWNRCSRGLRTDYSFEDAQGNKVPLV